MAERIYTASDIRAIFEAMAEEIETQAREARNDAAKEALYKVAAVFQSFDWEYQERTPAEQNAIEEN